MIIQKDTKMELCWNSNFQFGDETLMTLQLDYQNRPPLFITLAGLPGTGKTTLAKALTKKLSLVYLRLDCIEVPFYKYNASPDQTGKDMMQ